MPLLSSYLTALRGAHACFVYASFLTGESVLEGTLTADADTNGALNLAYTLTSGDAADVRPGMRIAVYTSGGDFKGTLSVRFAGTINSTNLPIRETSFGSVQMVTGDTFTVFDDFLPTDKLVSADESFAPDHAAYTDQTDAAAPIACSGGTYVGFLGDGGTLDIPFVGSTSYTVDPDSSGTLTHAWTASSGTWDDDTDPDPTLTVSAAGKYLVTHTVVDDDNTKTEVQYIRLRIHDANDPPLEVESLSINGDLATGFSASVRVYDGATLADVPDGVQVAIWMRQWLNGTEQAVGNMVPSRSHILCVGYLSRDRVTASDDQADTLEFDVISPLARYANLPGFSKALLRNASPADWQNIKGLTVLGGIRHLLRNYLNLTQLYDVIADNFADADYPAFYVQKATTLDQVRELADGRGGEIVADMLGRFEVRRKLQYMTLVERSLLPVTNFLSSLDIDSYDVTRDHLPVLETYRARGFKAGVDTSTTTPILVRFPSSPGRGPASPSIEKLIFDDLSDAFAQCALRGAWESRVYYSPDGVYYPAPEAQITLTGGYATAFQFYAERIGLTLPDNLRGTDLSAAAFYWLPQSVSIEFADGTMTTTLGLQGETQAPEAAGVEDPLNTSTTVTVSDPPYTYTPPLSDPTDDWLLGSTTYDIAFISDDGYLYLADTRPTSPVWSRYSLASLGMAGTPIMYIVDAFDFANGVLVTTTKGYRVLDIGSSGRTLNNEYAFRTSSNYRSLQSERGVEGFFACASHEDNARIDLDVTLDAGINWTRVANIGGDWPGTTGDNIYPGCYVHAGTPGKLLFGALDGTGTTSTGRMKVSTDFGATNSDADSNTVSGFLSDIHCPFQNEGVIFSGGGVSAGYLAYKLYRTVGGVRTDVSPSDGVENYGPWIQFGVKTCDVDPNSVLMAGLNRDTGTLKYGVWLARDGGLATASFSPLIAPTTSVKYRACAFAGNDPNTAWIWGANGAIAQSKNLNATVPTWKDLSGNLSSFTSPAVGRVLNIFGV